MTPPGHSKRSARKPPPARGRASTRFGALLPALALLALVALTYAQTASFGFVRDDEPLNLTHNPLLNGPSGMHLDRVWTRGYEGLYIPLSYTVWALLKLLGMALLGPEPPFHPALFHLVNVALHGLNVVLVFRLLRVVVRDGTAALLGATLFAIHPLQAESVAWVSELRGLLSAACALSSILLFLAGHRHPSTAPPSWRHFAPSAALMLLAVLAKPAGIVTPLLSLVLARVVRGVPWRRLAVTIAPQLLLILPFAVLTKKLQPTSYLTVFTPPWQRPLVWLDTIAFYLGKLVWPLGLGTSYARPPESIFRDHSAYWTWIVPVVLAALLVWRRRTLRLEAAGFALFVLGYLPISGLVPFAYQKWSTVADRFLYLPMLGAALAATAFYARANSGVRVALWVVAAALALRTGVVQTPTWKDEMTLWLHSLAVTPHDPRAHLCVGDLYKDRGDLRQAIDAYDRGLALAADASGYDSRANAYRELHRDAEARRDYDRAIELDPRDAETYNNRAILLLAQGQADAAMADCEQAIHLAPNDPRVYVGRGNVHFARRDFGAAIADYGHAIAIEPRDPRFYNNRAIAHAARGDDAAAIADYGRALEHDARSELALRNRARLQFQHQRWAEAIADLTRLIELTPGDADALKNRARANMMLGKPDLSLADLKRVQGLGQDVTDELRAVEAFQAQRAGAR